MNTHLTETGVNKMSDLNWFGKMILGAAFILSFFATQGIMDVADASTAKAPQVNTCKPIMADSTPLVFPYKTNAVINPTANWGLHSMSLKKAGFLMLPHEYRGQKVCVLDTRAGAGLMLNCEAILNHGRKEAFHAFNDGWVLLHPAK
jgi:hypothetical protein